MTRAIPDTNLRFGFGKNWQSFLEQVDDSRIEIALASLQDRLGVQRLDGCTFLDIGCGSGLFSLAALRLGAEVTSFDYDADSVAATRSLQELFASASPWRIEQGSVLDAPYLESLGTFDVVYSWGVLHHTGEMWRAVDLASKRVAPGGQFFIALYNDQDRVSHLWRLIKRIYNRLPRFVRPMYVAVVGLPRELGSLVLATLAREPGRYVRGWTHYSSTRGMSRWHDLVDWVGGYPFEVAAPDAVVNKMLAEGYQLEHLTTCGRRLGCNEYVFRKT